LNRIPDKYLSQVRKRLSILDVVSPYCDLQRQGANWISSCPFPDHEDADPSFTVSPEKELFKCFGCGRGGNMFSFLQLMEGLTFSEAVKHCADKVGMDFPFATSTSTTFDQLLQLHKDAAKHYFITLIQDPDKLLYLIGSDRDRGQRCLTMDTVKRYGLGYCDGSFALDASRAYPPDLLNTSGIFYHRDRVAQDIMLGRWVFPITNMTGHIIALGGGKPGGEPKYRNSSESEIYKKTTSLYGLLQAKDHIRKMKFAVLVEGYFDVLTLSQNGYPNTIGACGTAFTGQQAKLLKRLTNKVVIALDGDPAGYGAIYKTFAALFNAGIDHVLVCRCPQGKDPDDVFKADQSAGVNMVVQSISFLDWLVPAGLTAVESEKVILTARQVISYVNDTNRRQLLTHFLSNRLNVAEKVLATISLPKTKMQDDIPGTNIEYNLLACLLKEQPSIDQMAIIKSFGFSDPIVEQMYETILQLHETSLEHDIRIVLFDHLPPELGSLASLVVSLSDTAINLSVVLPSIKAASSKRAYAKQVQQVQTLEKNGMDCLTLIESRWG